MMGGSVQSILATGGVHLQQPGRTAIGERLLYTAADDRYLLTGTPAVPPRVDDSQHGNVTGASLIFHAGSDSVEVSGETGRRVRTETDASRSSRSH
jgi:lipopolysaccharide export system protein LptA